MADDVRSIVVTGAAGHLGSHLAPELVREGFSVRGLDIVAPASPPQGYELLHADLTDRDALTAALDGADMVVHCASIHPWKPYSDDQYFDANVKGTWNLYRAAAERGIARVVLTSSICAAGCAPVPPGKWPIREDDADVPNDIYSLTKGTQETIARQFAVHNGIRTIAVRPPAFMPLDSVQTAFQLLGAYALLEDVVSAHVAAVRVMTGRATPGVAPEGFEAVFCVNAHPYSAIDGDLLGSGGTVSLALASAHYPHAAAWLEDNGFQGAWMPGVHDVSKARALLGWEARWGFDRWFAEHGGRA